LRSRSVIGIELELLMSGDFTDDVEWGGRPNDFDNQWVDRLRDSVVGVVLTGWSPLQQKLGALLQARLFKVEELEDISCHHRHAATPPPFSPMTDITGPIPLNPTDCGKWLWRWPPDYGEYNDDTSPWDNYISPPSSRVPHKTNSRGGSHPWLQLPPPCLVTDRRRGRVPVTQLTKTLFQTSSCWQM